MNSSLWCCSPPLPLPDLGLSRCFTNPLIEPALSSFVSRLLCFCVVPFPLFDGVTLLLVPAPRFPQWKYQIILMQFATIERVKTLGIFETRKLATFAISRLLLGSQRTLSVPRWDLCCHLRDHWISKRSCAVYDMGLALHLALALEFWNLPPVLWNGRPGIRSTLTRVATRRTNELGSPVASQLFRRSRSTAR